MPWPTNSRTTENPFASTYDCTAAPMSDTRAPAFTAATARSSAVFVTSSSRSASGVMRPTGTVTAESPKNPSSLAPMSIETMSPSVSGRSFGMPCTTCSFTDAQIVAGYP